LLGLPVLALAQGGLPAQPYIYVVGKAEIQKPAEIVTMRFDLMGQNPDQSKANQDVQAKASKILGLLNERRIAEGDVVATDITSQPDYERDDEGTRGHGKLIGYTVTRSFAVKLRDLPALPKLVDDLLAIPGVEFKEVNAGLANEKQVRDDVWAKALANAREQAQKTLTPLGTKVGSVFAVSPVAFPQITQEIFGYVEATAERAAVASGNVDPSQYRLAPITVEQRVHVIFLTAPAK
jgi:uncharacterized protein YggE